MDRRAGDRVASPRGLVSLPTSKFPPESATRFSPRTGGSTPMTTDLFWTRGHLLVTRAIVTVALAACCGAGLAQAQPIIDGNGDDLVNFAAGIGNNGCAVDRDDPRDDIAVADAKVDPCATLEDTDGNG